MSDLSHQEVLIRINPREPQRALADLQKILEASFGRVLIAVNSKQDEDGELNCKVYSQDAEPTLEADQNAAFWIDTDGGPAYYLIFRVSSGTQVKVALT
jgi:hypothetical protein